MAMVLIAKGRVFADYARWCLVARAKMPEEQHLSLITTTGEVVRIKLRNVRTALLTYLVIGAASVAVIWVLALFATGAFGSAPRPIDADIAALKMTAAIVGIGLACAYGYYLTAKNAVSYTFRRIYAERTFC